MFNMKISVVVCTKNRMEDIMNFTKSLYSQTRLPEQYIIIDASDVPLNQSANFNQFFSKPDSTELIYVHTKPGLTFQRNIGAGKAKGDIIFFFDDDVILENKYLEIMIKAYSNKQQYMGGMGTMTNYERRALWRMLLSKFFMLQMPLGDGKFFLSGFPKHPYGQNKFMATEVLSGCMQSYRRKIFTEDGYRFDENLGGYSFMEDVDFSRRVSFKYPLFYEPAAKCVHLSSPADRDKIKISLEMYVKNHIYLFFKNHYKNDKTKIVFLVWSIIGLYVYLGIRKNFKAAIDAWIGLTIGVISKIEDF